MIKSHIFSLAIASSLVLMAGVATAQTSEFGGDKATGWSFEDDEAKQSFQNDNPNADLTNASTSSEADIDSALANEKLINSRFRVQLIVAKTKETLLDLVKDLNRQYPDLFVDHPIAIDQLVGDNPRYRLLVTGFDAKDNASDWCVEYAALSSSECLMLDSAASSKANTDKRVEDVVDKLKGKQPSGNENAPASNFARPEDGMVFHQFQRAWEKADSSAGVFEARYCASCSYKMNLRELMISTFEVPKGEVITGFDVGDPAMFEAQLRADNSLAVMAKTFGTDTNLNIYTESGRVYPVYLRALDVRSPLLPDILFRVIDPSITYTEVKKPDTIKEVAALIDAPKKVNTLDFLNAIKPASMSEEDFIEGIPFDPAKITFKGFRVSGSSDMKLAPDIVFRDDAFIFIYYKDPNKVPAFESYSVVDEYDELLGTAIHGKLYAIKALVPLVALKSGNSYLCIEIDLKAA